MTARDSTITDDLRRAVHQFDHDQRLARETDVPQTSISLFRTSQRGLRLDTAEKLINFFGCRFQLTMPKPKNKREAEVPR